LVGCIPNAPAPLTIEDGCVDPPRRRRLTLELETAQHPIAGILSDEGGIVRPFTGWIGLAQALEALLDPASDQALPTGSPGSVPQPPKSE
jgi:hypothetical protein